MAKQPTKVSEDVLARSRQLLAFAKEQAARAADWVESHNALAYFSEWFFWRSQRTAARASYWAGKGWAGAKR